MREYILYTIILLLTAVNVYTYRTSAQTIDTLQNSCKTLAVEISNIQKIEKETDTLITSWTAAITAIQGVAKETSADVENISTPWDATALPDEYIRVFSPTKNSNRSQISVSGTTNSDAAAKNSKDTNTKNK